MYTYGGKVALHKQLVQLCSSTDTFHKDDNLIEIQGIKQVIKLPILLQLTQFDVVLSFSVRCVRWDTTVHRYKREIRNQQFSLYLYKSMKSQLGLVVNINFHGLKGTNVTVNHIKNRPEVNGIQYEMNDGCTSLDSFHLVYLFVDNTLSHRRKSHCSQHIACRVTKSLIQIRQSSTLTARLPHKEKIKSNVKRPAGKKILTPLNRPNSPHSPIKGKYYKN